MKIIAPQRERDEWGEGAYRAPRGERTHNGVDFACYPDSTVLACRSGTVTKLGYPYADDLSYRYVEVTDIHGDRWRYFYVDPDVTEGDSVDAGDALGVTQYLGRRYPGITEHCHLEIIGTTGDYIDPEVLL